MIATRRGAASPRGAAEHQPTDLDRRWSAIRTGAAVGVGLFLIPVAARWLAEIEWVRYSDNATTQSLFPHSTALVVFLAALSALVRLVVPCAAFTRREILICYVCMCVGSHYGGHDMLQILYSSIAYVINQAKPENGFADLIHPYLPAWSVPSAGPGLRAFFEGQSSLRAPGNWESWRAPVLTWGGFTLILGLVMLAVANLLRRQWDNERLTYPIAQVPLWMTVGNGRNMLSPHFLIGTAIGILPLLFNTIKYFKPVWPALNVGVTYSAPLDGVWAAAGSFPTTWHPFAFGLAYLIPTDLLFSCWFFYLFTCLEQVIFYAMGYRVWSGFPYSDQQATGAHLGLALLVLYNARRHIKFVAREVLRPDRTRGTEALGYRASVVILAAGCLFLLWWLRQMGFSWLTGAIWLGLFMAVVLAVTRLRAEYGLPTNELFQKGPEYIMTCAAGSRSFTRSEQVGMAMMNWLTRTHRQLPMQVQVDMLEVGKRGGIAPVLMGRVLIAATLVGIVAAKWALLDVSMRTGIATAKVHGPAMWAFGPEPWNKLVSWINSPTDPSTGQTLGFASGAAFCAVLYKLRVAITWWPLHPGGYVMSRSFGLQRLWVPLFLTWCFKACVVRYGGHTVYVRYKPLFLGLVAGEYCSAIVRTLIDIKWQVYFPAESGIGGL